MGLNYVIYVFLPSNHGETQLNFVAIGLQIKVFNYVLANNLSCSCSRFTGKTVICRGRHAQKAQNLNMYFLQTL